MWTMYFKTDKTSRPKTVAEGTKPSKTDSADTTAKQKLEFSNCNKLVLGRSLCFTVFCQFKSFPILLAEVIDCPLCNGQKPIF